MDFSMFSPDSEAQWWEHDDIEMQKHSCKYLALWMHVEIPKYDMTPPVSRILAGEEYSSMKMIQDAKIMEEI